LRRREAGDYIQRERARHRAAKSEGHVSNYLKLYIDGKWVDPVEGRSCDVINPATGEVAGRVMLGGKADVDKAVAAARRAFPAFSASSRESRLALLERIVAGYERRIDELAHAMTIEMGSTITFSRQGQAENALGHFKEAHAILKDYVFEYPKGTALIRREPIGVCGLITPWNAPLNQIAMKLAPAIAAGCTTVLKPSEIAPLSAILLAEVLDEAGVPAGVFNLVNGDGPTVGEAISGHPGIDMVSFTGSTRAGIMVAKSAADTVKKVTQELGGKSANVIMPDADIDAAVAAGVLRCFNNAGQSCQSPTRMLVQRGSREAAIQAARRAAATLVIGDTLDPKTTLGPVASKAQWDKVQRLIEAGIDEGATLVTGGPGLPDGITLGWYVRPTVFADVTSEMTIARQEIFGPVLSMMFYDTEDDAVRLANETDYGLAGYVQGRDMTAIRRVASRIRAGRIFINAAKPDRTLPFGGYKQSGNGREQGIFGFEEYLEVKAVLGYETA